MVHATTNAQSAQLLLVASLGTKSVPCTKMLAGAMPLVIVIAPVGLMHCPFGKINVADTGVGLDDGWHVL